MKPRLHSNMRCAKKTLTTNSSLLTSTDATLPNEPFEPSKTILLPAFAALTQTFLYNYGIACSLKPLPP
jgi:hypothetical protein